MTSQSQQIILTALREYKRENLAKARAISEGGLAVQRGPAQQIFEEHMRIDDAVEIAMQEIAVAQ